jgi:pimeloyl-ACP methyl ester carboxylesterase
VTEFPVNWTDASGVAHTTQVTETDNAPDPSLPVVLLLHGMGGNIHHMSDPTISPGIQFDVDFTPPDVIDRGWHAYPNVGIWSISTSPPNTTPGWQPALAQHGYKALNYAQVGPEDSLHIPAVELDAVFRAVLDRFSSKRVILVCHSRGGLLARLFLQRNRNDLNVLSRLAGVVTLHAPHQGSQVADFAFQVHTAINALRGGNDEISSVLDALDSMVMNPCIADLRPSSQLLASLAAGESAPLPVFIPIHTFGGTNPRLVSVFLSEFDWISAVPQFHLPPFNWITNQSTLLNALDGTPVADICPEERFGGDVLVTETRSHLPREASHHVNPVNHANALNHAGIQAQARSMMATMRSNASFVTHSVPGHMNKGGTYPVSITMTNTGSSTWVSGVNCPFRLGYRGATSVWGVNRRDVPNKVHPGGTATFNFDVTAPSQDGFFLFQWSMLQENIEWFGANTQPIQVIVGQPQMISGFTVEPISPASGNYLTIMVRMAHPAPAGGLSVRLISSHPNVVAPVSYLNIPAGATSATTTTRAASVPFPTGVTLTVEYSYSSASRTVVVSPSAAYPYGTAMAAGVGGSLL